jgi:uroporphyrinogen-III decarboxylase
MMSGREFYLGLARSGLRMPIGADLELHEEPDPEAVKFDAVRLGRVVERTARRFRTPLAFPLMDLTLEKADLLAAFGIPQDEAAGYHFDVAPSREEAAEVIGRANRPFPARIAANQGAIRYIAECTDLVPAGMLIGPFSLMTKLAPDPITPVAMAGAGVGAEEDPEVRLVERCLDLAEATVQRSARAQIAAGARAVIVCEPAANVVYLSPRQLRSGSDIFERFVLGPNRRLRDLVRSCGADLIFHNCGELTTEMVRRFAHELRPVVLSLGSSRKLWDDARVVPPDVVLFGNLPTKTFYSDSAMPVDEVRRLTAELLERMARCGHPHILGSECDVLYVPDAARTIRRKVEAMLTHLATLATQPNPEK